MNSSVQILSAGAQMLLLNHATRSRALNLSRFVHKLVIKNEGGHFPRGGICDIRGINNIALEAVPL